MDTYPQPVNAAIVVQMSFQTGQRLGQYLVNSLPHGAYHEVSGSPIDVFHKVMEPFEVQQWIDDHLILNTDKTEILGVFVNNHIVWEAS